MLQFSLLTRKLAQQAGIGAMWFARYWQLLAIEFLWCTTSRRQHRLLTTGSIIGFSSIEPSSSSRDVGVFIDSNLSMVSGEPCQANCLLLLQDVTTATQYPATGTDRCLPVTGRRVGPQPAWLLQQCAGCTTCQLDPASSVGSKRWRTVLVISAPSLTRFPSSILRLFSSGAPILT